jgi:phage N-6-adenine-methyltransferase
MANDEWETPQRLFENISKHFNFDIDVCANNSNHKVDAYFTREDDALKQTWNGICWMNPPYSRGNIGQFTKKALEESLVKNAMTVALLPVDVSTKWFQNDCLNPIGVDKIFLLDKRIKFELDGKPKDSPTFSSCIVVFFNNLEFNPNIEFYRCSHTFDKFTKISG